MRVASPLSGTLLQLAVERGTQVAHDAPLFTLESEQERAARAEAEARVRQAQATLANLEKARRPPEIAAVRAQLAQAQASLRQSEADLVANREARRRQVPAAATARPGAGGARSRPRARRRIEPAGADRQPAGAQRRDRGARPPKSRRPATRWRRRSGASSRNRRRHRQPVSLSIRCIGPANGLPAGSPVVSLLPPANVKIRFYVPETHGRRAAHRRRGDRAVRRLRAGHRGDDTLHRAAGRVHAARDLQPGESREPRVPGRGAARPRRIRRLHPGLPVEVACRPGRGDGTT